MDTNKLITESKARFKHNESKLYLEEKYINRLVIANQGGMWNVTPELIAFLKTTNGEVILQDSFQHPVKINASELLAEAEYLYNAVMEAWLTEYTELQTNR